jgi:asparagine synthase (glutamine-hydrolysing)
MTAIAGVWRFDGRQDAADRCATMLAAQKIYGADAEAQWSGGCVALGRRLMRLLPEDAFDRQPLVGGGGRFIFVADVRLDNREELTNALQISSSDARTLCDAAILLAAFERWEESCFDRLVGDYAFALWDTVGQRLVLARDPLGQRPLHYHRGSGFFAFASMPKGLHSMAEIPYALNKDRIAEFLVLMPHKGSLTFFHGVERVEPAQILIVTRDGISLRRHWQPCRRPIVLSGHAEYAEQLCELLDNAVRSRLRGTRDVGVSLSGGLDSSAVAATTAQLLARTNHRVLAFTAVPRAGYDGPGPANRINDEAPYAAATAAMYPNIEHVLIQNPDRSPLDDLDRNFMLFEEPILNICNIGWINAINDAARERRLNVLLLGLKGNIGLSYKGMPLLPMLLLEGRWIQWWHTAKALIERQGMTLPTIMVKTMGPWMPAVIWHWLHRRIGILFDVSSHSAINPCRFAELDLAARARERNFDLAFRPATDGFSERLAALKDTDIGNFNKGVLAGWHIDFRDPTADKRLLEFCLAVPMQQYLRDGVPRALARHALANRLPKFVIDAGGRGLQAADWHERLTKARDRVAAELDRLGACPDAVRALDLPRLRQLVERWPTNGWERDEVMVPYRLALLRGISAGHFIRRVAGSNR